MKEYQIVARPTPLTTIHVSGQPRHFFNSEKLGNCRAILSEDLPRKPEKSHLQMVEETIDEFEQEQAKKAEKPLSKGDKLKILMDCGDRLHKRYQSYFAAYCALAETDFKGRDKVFAKVKRVGKAQDRILKKISDLMLGKETIYSPSPIAFFAKLKNSQLRAAHEEQRAIWTNYWDSDLDPFEDAYAAISEKLNLINDEIYERERRGNWS